MSRAQVCLSAILVTVLAFQTAIAKADGRDSEEGRLAGAMNEGLVEFIGAQSYNNITGFVVPETSFGVPYIEFTATEETLGQIASFKGSLQVAKVDKNELVFPLIPSPDLSPVCQLTINFESIRPV